MADTKALRTRIKSVDSTLHLTKAMGLVASSKIRRATDAANKSKQYAAALGQALDALTSCGECQKSAYMQQREGQTRLVTVAGDRGLAGGYNANIFRLLRDEFPTAGSSVTVIPIGKRACDRFGDHTVPAESFTPADARALAEQLCREFADGAFARLGVVCTRYESMMSQQAEVRWLLPLQRPEEAVSTGMIFEPDERTILETVVPAYVAGQLYAAVRESFLCEVAARRMAMDSAGKNAQQMIDNLQLAYNRARQGAITQEITEIVAGSGQ